MADEPQFCYEVTTALDHKFYVVALDLQEATRKATLAAEKNDPVWRITVLGRVI
jgi:hypothetical protein